MARGGSKGVPKKNIRLLGGYPLIAYSIAACHLTLRLQRTIISTDDEEIADIARSFDADVPFKRPVEFARDDSTDKQVFEHAINWFTENEKYTPEYWIHIRPTTPLREPYLLDQSIERIAATPEATSLVSVHEIEESPGKMFGMLDGYLHGLCPLDPRPEYFTLPRQEFPPVYFGNGYVDIVRTSTLDKYNSCYGPRMLSFLAPDTGEIDREEDFKELNYFLQHNKYTLYEYLENKYSHLKRENE